ncbi:MAG: carbon storage regulator CsrA [Candidatus Cybelea sp.]
MLVLSRKANQSIMIGDAIRIIVVGFDGDQVKLGIEAPRDVPVHRFEIFEEIKRRSPSACAPAEDGRARGLDPG